MELFLIEGNREIATARVNESYNRLKSKGFIKEVGMIEYVTGNCLEGKKILSAKIEMKENGKPKSLTNWRLATEEVPYTEGMKVCADGQGRYVALMLRQMLDGDNKVDDESIYREVVVPTGMDVIEFILLKNSGKPWNIKDAFNTAISSGNPYVDRLTAIAKESGLENQAIYNFGTLFTGDLSNKTVLCMMEKTKALPKTISLSDSNIEVATIIVDIIADHHMLTKNLVTSRFSKGLKLFCKDNEITKADDVFKVITAITKHLWDQHFTPEHGTSAEPKKYAEGFLKIYELINEQATEPIQSVVPFRIEAAAV